MSKKGSSRHELRRRYTREELDGHRKNRPRKRSPVLIVAAVIAVVVVLVGVGAYYYILNQPAKPKPELVIIDCVGSKVRTTDTTLVQVKFTVKNNGTGSIDLARIVLSWEGPKAQATLYLDKGAYSSASKESFGVGGSGSVKDGWDPTNGKFLIKDDTLVWIVVNLTAAGGVGDPVGVDQGLKITLTVEDHGEATGTTASAKYRTGDDLGNGLYVNLSPLE